MSTLGIDSTKIYRFGWTNKSWKDLEIMGRGPVVIADDVKAALAEVKPSIALYAGAINAIPAEYVDEAGLYGSIERIEKR